MVDELLTMSILRELRWADCSIQGEDDWWHGFWCGDEMEREGSRQADRVESQQHPLKAGTASCCHTRRMGL